MSEYTKTFEENKLLEKNSYQEISLGFYKENPSREVLINKINKFDSYNEYYNDLFECILDSYITSGIIDNKLILVTENISGDSIGLYFNFSKTTDKQRIEFVNDYLTKITSYISLDNSLLNALISSNQIVFKDDKLYLKEYLVLDNLKSNLNISMITKNIGQVIQRLLATNNKNKHDKLFDDIYKFSESLIRREKKYTSYDEMLDDFKAIYSRNIKFKNKIMNYSNHPNNMDIDYRRIRSELITGDQINPKKHRNNFHYENIDLSKLDTATSLDDIIIREEEKYVLINNMVIKKDNDFILENNIKPIHNESIMDKYKERIKEENIKEDVVVEEVKKVEKDDAVEEVKNETTDFTKNLSKINEEINEEEKDDDIAVYIREEKSEDIGLPNHLKNEMSNRKVDEKKKLNVWIPILSILIIILIGLLYLLFNSSTVNDEYKLPLAKFEVTIKNGTILCENLSSAYGGEIIVESFWEIKRDGKLVLEQPGSNKADFKANGLVPGKYSIKLTVTDSRNNFSDPYVIDKVYSSDDDLAMDETVFDNKNIMANLSDENLDTLEISTSLNITEDKELFNSGNKSLMIDLNDEDSASMSILKDIPKGSTASFMLLPKKTNSVNLYISAYNTGDLIYQKKIKINNTSLSWNTISFQINSEIDADQLILKFKGVDNILWFDDILVRTFK